MKGLTIFFLIFCSFLVSLFIDYTAAEANNNGVYIVYMGAVTSASASLKVDHAQLLASVSKKKKNALVHSYRHGFSGFAARLSAIEARALSEKPGVVSVFPDPIIKFHTTHSWNFLRHQNDDLEINPNAILDAESLSDGSDTIIGIIDTGIWPESESFNDKGMGPIPSRWKGACVVGNNENDNGFKCNRKIIGARGYDIDDFSVPPEWNLTDTPRDIHGHGTHVAAIAAGRVVRGASYYGLAAGTAKGGSPGSRIAVYNICSMRHACTGSNILAAFDDAIADGVDIISVSLTAYVDTGPGSLLDIMSKPISIGAFHAVEHGIPVVCSAGNDGPTGGSVVNDAPWILTVAASTIDRHFESDVVLGGNIVIKGVGINLANLKKSPVYPLIHAKSAMKKGADENEARNCYFSALDWDLVKEKIVLCDKNNFISVYAKRDQIGSIGGIGVIVIDDETRAEAFNFKEFPMTLVSSEDGKKILSYVNSTRNPVATILPTALVKKYKPAPEIPYFSARGPSSMTRNIIKPDIAAPGVNILAAWIPNDTQITLDGKVSPLFNVLSGTSMACPHVSAIAATVKYHNPTWSPSTIKSAIMTTATRTNNLGTPITKESGSIATPYDFGAGQVSLTAPLNPGLVYETTVVDYLNFLCYSGYNASKIKNITKNVPDGFTCPKDSSIDLVSNINYPSIAISSFNGKKGRIVSRTLTNVAGTKKSTYAVTVDAPQGLNVKVIPDKLQFTKKGQKLSYQVMFSSALSSLKEDIFGSITWTNEKYKVRSPFVVSSKSGKSSVVTD